MRQYRGFTKEGKWVYGSYTHIHDVDGNPSIIPSGKNIFVSVLPESVGQFVCKDRNDKDVFEGDKTTAIVCMEDLPNFRITGKVTLHKCSWAIKTKMTIYELNGLRDIELVEE